MLSAGLCFAEYEQDFQDIEKSISEFENIENQNSNEPGNINDSSNINPNTTGFNNQNSNRKNIQETNEFENQRVIENTQKYTKKNTNQFSQNNENSYSRNYQNQRQYENNNATSSVVPSYPQNSLQERNYDIQNKQQNTRQTENYNSVGQSNQNPYISKNSNDNFTVFFVIVSFAAIFAVTGLVLLFLYFCKKILCLNIPYLPNIKVRKQNKKDIKNIKKKKRKKRNHNILITKVKNKNRNDYINQPEEVITNETVTNTITDNFSYEVDLKLKLKNQVINAESPTDIKSAVILFTKITS